MPITLSFRTKEVRERCERPQSADWTPTAQQLDDLRECLANIEAGISTSDVFKLPGMSAIPEGEGWRLRLRSAAVVVLCNHRGKGPPMGEDGSVDWSRVRRLRIEEVDLD